MSDISSAGITRDIPGCGKTSGKDVLRRVDVPVVPGAAGRARPVPRRKAQLREQVPARRAGLADDGYQRSITISSRPYRWHLYSSWRRNSPHPQSEIARARNRLRTMPETFRSSITMTSAERTRPVLARCRKSCRASRTLRWARATFDLGLGPVRGSFLAAGQAPLVAGQVPGLALQVPRVGDLLPVAGHGEVRHAEVDADRVPGLLQWCRGVGVDGEGHVPAAVRLPGHDHHRRVQRGHVHVRPRPGEPQRPAGLGQPQHPAAHRERGPGVVRGLPAAAGLEPRVAGASGEERGECPVLVAQRLLQRHARTPRSGRPGPGPASSRVSAASVWA